MAKGALETLVDKCEEDITARLDNLRSGGLDFNEYKYVCGQIRGLELARDHIKGLLQQLRKEEDDD
jgi:hypothetical protein